ncbi:SO2930 family diheme c-type cytochrome [Parendozoicomonas haliclonae]|uniref:Cytochrome c domain-containing protein n=1 Tax=Parendozoicomonas haliclonae TaxID=1960125 RepID=A0A1X7ART8_9GAMM|nr:SO2930 family diheme c-type cytochrome [Parendozoicomonas haliclonae]SMA50863.1 hypothetical protein EHSB41UT_04681 [Parendozoicomonas haliclonae]
MLRSLRAALWSAVLAGAAFVLSGCSPSEPLLKTSGSDYPQTLSEWNVLLMDSGQLRLNDNVLPYDLNTPLFTDYASKLRTVWMPDGAVATPAADGERIDYPVGTILTKTFYYPRTENGVQATSGEAVLYTPGEGLPMDKVRLMETRVLVHQEQGWVALPYIWNDEQTHAVLDKAGDVERLNLVKTGGTEEFVYIVPDANQCAGCHADGKSRRAVQPLGPKLRHLNRDLIYKDGSFNQLEYWTERGLLSGIELQTVAQNALWPNAREGETLEHRARSYLDVNCGHCHNGSGPARNSGLWLTISTHSNKRLGFCKTPIAAGKGTGNRLVSIQPGKPQESILTYRLETTDPGEMMPELGRSLSHSEGVALVSEWIASLQGGCEEQLAVSVDG